MNRFFRNNRPSDWEDEYIRLLPTGLRAAGWYIQKYFQDKGIGCPDFRWIQTTLQKPAFQHLCFAYGGNIYSVLIEIQTPQGNYISEQDTDNQIRECADNDLTACIIPLRIADFKPVVSDVHLIATDTRLPIIMQKRSSPVPMSPWEINSLGVQIVRDEIVSQGNKLLSYCDVLHIEPQIWYEDRYGKRCYVIVDAVVGIGTKNPEHKLNHNLLMKFIDYDGYYAEVGISDPMDMTSTTLYRDSGFYINYKGLQIIERRAAQVGTNSQPIFIIREK